LDTQAIIRFSVVISEWGEYINEIERFQGVRIVGYTYYSSISGIKKVDD
jgi:hypothetical protein